MENYKELIMEILAQKIEELQNEIEFLEMKNENLLAENKALREKESVKEALGYPLPPKSEHTFAT